MGGKSAGPTGRGPYSTGNEELAWAAVDGDRVSLFNCRDSTYLPDERTEATWIDLELDAGELTNLWVYFYYFSSFKGVAHTELCFEFADGTCLVASFEVRTLKGQSYGIVAGMGKNFELVLRWTTERDSLTRRSTNERLLTRGHMFEADITHGRLVELFHAMIKRTNELHDEPEWYNTITNTCTTAIMDVVHQVLPGQVKRTPLVLLPGMLPKRWARQGVLKYEGDFATAFDNAFVSDRVIEIGDVPDLSRQLHNRGPHQR